MAKIHVFTLYAASPVSRRGVGGCCNWIRLGCFRFILEVVCCYYTARSWLGTTNRWGDTLLPAWFSWVDIFCLIVWNLLNLNQFYGSSKLLKWQLCQQSITHTIFCFHSFPASSTTCVCVRSRRENAVYAAPAVHKNFTFSSQQKKRMTVNITRIDLMGVRCAAKWIAFEHRFVMLACVSVASGAYYAVINYCKCVCTVWMLCYQNIAS